MKTITSCVAALCLANCAPAQTETPPPVVVQSGTLAATGQMPHEAGAYSTGTAAISGTNMHTTMSQGAAVASASATGNYSPPRNHVLTASKYEIVTGETIALTASVTDPDGDIICHSIWWDGGEEGGAWRNPAFDWAGGQDDRGWSNITGANGEDIDPCGSNTITANWTGFAPGSYTFHTNAYDSNRDWGQGIEITIVVRASPQPDGGPQPVTSADITVSTANGRVSASGGESMDIYLGESLSISSTVTAAGWLSEHNVVGYWPSSMGAFLIPDSIQTLPATASTTTSARALTWTPSSAGTYGLYVEAFTGSSPGERTYGVSGYPGFAGGPFGGLANKRVTVNVNPASSPQPVLLTPPMTGNAAPAPYVATASSEAAVYHAAWGAWDQVADGPTPSSGWISRANAFNASTGAGSEWNQIYLGVSKTLHRVSLRSRIANTSTGETGRAPRDFQILVKRDGGDFDVIDSVVDNPRPTANYQIIYEKEYLGIAFDTLRVLITRTWVGASGMSAIGEIELYGTDAPPPAEPGNPATSAITDTSVTLTWEGSTDSGITYEIERSTDGLTFSKIADISGALSYTDTGLESGVTYYYRMRSSRDGTSDYTTTLTITTLPPSEPPDPGTLPPQTGLRLWLKAGAGVETDNTGQIIRWRDQSTSQAHAILAQDGVGPRINDSSDLGFRTLVFDGQTSALELPPFMDNATAATAYIIVKSEKTANPLWLMGATEAGTLYPGESGQIEDDFASTTARATRAPTPPLYEWHAYRVTSANGVWWSAIDQTLLQTKRNMAVESYTWNDTASPPSRSEISVGYLADSSGQPPLPALLPENGHIFEAKVHAADPVLQNNYFGLYYIGLKLENGSWLDRLPGTSEGFLKKTLFASGSSQFTLTLDEVEAFLGASVRDRQITRIQLDFESAVMNASGAYASASYFLNNYDIKTNFAITGSEATNQYYFAELPEIGGGFKGEIAEILIYDQSAVADESVNDYLSSKYGVFVVDLNKDTDGDGMPDAWEIANGLNPLDPADAYMDTDGDGFSNIDEYRAGTNPSIAEPVLSPPTGLTASPVDEQGVFLSWGAPISMNTSVSKYELERKTETGSFEKIADIAAYRTSFLDKNLVDGGTYIYRIRAFGDSSPSQFSNEASATTLSIPSAPSSLNVTNITRSGCKLSWNAPAGAADGFVYEIQLDEVYLETVPGISLVITDLSPQTNYSVRIRARNTMGICSAWSNAATFTTQSQAQPPPAVTLTATTAYPKTISLSWTPIPGASYVVERRCNDVRFWIPQSTWHFQTIASFPEGSTGFSEYVGQYLLFRNTSYTYRIRAVIDGQYGPYSDEVNVHTSFAPDDIQPYPVNLRIISYSPSHISLAWDGRGNGGTFELFCNGQWVEIVSGNEFTHELWPNAVPGQIFSYTVFEYTGDYGTTPTLLCIPLVFTMPGSPDTTPPSVPAGLKASNVSLGGFTLAWEPSSDNVCMSKYEVAVNGVSRGETYDTRMDFSDLDLRTPLSVSVRACDVAGNWSNYSDATRVSLADTEIRMNLRETYSAPDGVILTWDLADESYYQSYDLYRDGIWVDNVNPPEFLDTNITFVPGQSYVYTIYITDESGVFLASSTRTVTIPFPPAPPVPPPAPENLRWSGRVNNDVTIAWDAVPAAHGVLYYEIYRTWIKIATVYLDDGQKTGSFTDKNRTSTGWYQYHVRAVAAGGNGSSLSAPLVVDMRTSPAWWGGISMQIFDGNNQTGRPNEFLAKPFSVKIQGPDSENQPITFTLVEDEGSLHENIENPGATEFTVIADDNGKAQIWYLLSARDLSHGKIRASTAGKQLIFECFGNGAYGASGGGSSNIDTDGDGVPDAMEIAHGFNPNDPSDVFRDTDGDGVSDYLERVMGTDPTSPHSLYNVILDTPDKAYGVKTSNWSITPVSKR